MADVAFILLTIAFFTAIAVLARHAGDSDSPKDRS
ncbi:hypothetical protein SAMN05216410_1770 [Sanguibacter gelidistatuariae]|uniref:Uncharacterized protein n=1 Tax=Sanguibacter gelidistatuariae TaxID=1814289 RepID=A0A1G6L6M8_9MICO|nr:hypothetical protein SAMN05216410_1770 [Sanguibacter gelidistatuariae]